MESDAELIARSLAGDGEAFVEVIGRHEAVVGPTLRGGPTGRGPRIGRLPRGIIH
jgi:hypothetical protein